MATFDAFGDGVAQLREGKITAKQLHTAVCEKYGEGLAELSQEAVRTACMANDPQDTLNVANLLGEMFMLPVESTKEPGVKEMFWEMIMREIQQAFMKNFRPFILVFMARLLVLDTDATVKFKKIFPGPMLEKVGPQFKDMETISNWNEGKATVIRLVFQSAGAVLDEFCVAQNKNTVDHMFAEFRKVMLSDSGTENTRATCLHLLELRAHDWTKTAFPLA